MDNERKFFIFVIPVANSAARCFDTLLTFIEGEGGRMKFILLITYVIVPHH